MLVVFPGEPSSSNVCHARGAQGLGLLARVHCGIQVQRQVSGVLPAGLLPRGHLQDQKSLHLDQGHYHHPQYNCGQALDRPGKGCSIMAK